MSGACVHVMYRVCVLLLQWLMTKERLHTMTNQKTVPCPGYEEPFDDGATAIIDSVTRQCPELLRRRGHRPGGSLIYKPGWSMVCPTCNDKGEIQMEEQVQLRHFTLAPGSATFCSRCTLKFKPDEAIWCTTGMSGGPIFHCGDCHSVVYGEYRV